MPLVQLVVPMQDLFDGEIEKQKSRQLGEYASRKTVLSQQTETGRPLGKYASKKPILSQQTDGQTSHTQTDGHRP